MYVHVCYLVHPEQLEKTNYSSIHKIFDRSIGIISFQHDDVLLSIPVHAPPIPSSSRGSKGKV